MNIVKAIEFNLDRLDIEIKEILEGMTEGILWDDVCGEYLLTEDAVCINMDDLECSVEAEYGYEDAYAESWKAFVQSCVDTGASYLILWSHYDAVTV